MASTFMAHVTISHYFNYNFNSCYIRPFQYFRLWCNGRYQCNYQRGAIGFFLLQGRQSKSGQYLASQASFLLVCQAHVWSQKCLNVPYKQYIIQDVLIFSTIPADFWTKHSNTLRFSRVQTHVRWNGNNRFWWMWIVLLNASLFELIS